ncbi:hypothetical protein FOA52_000160 [Chlamydomonas sp. UWO 241]|nr:hypothetical protein FOA52_000160 [Chlamydomonas sp. UWO 241]
MDPMCATCLAQNSAFYWDAGVYKVCASCSCSEINPAMHAKCYQCLAWARPGNYDGEWCTKCSKLHDEPLRGGPHSAHACFDCVVNLDSFCINPNSSCADPPAGMKDEELLLEIPICWDCMAKHKKYLWGAKTCGDPV